MATANKKPKISIVITCYNYEKYIRTSIESVLNQGYLNKELIVVDDVSSDKSRSIISEYNTQVSTLFHEENKGHGGAFNSGFSLCTGDLVMFLDADDYLLPGALETVACNFAVENSLYMYHMDLVDSEGEAYDVFPKYEAPFDTAEAKEKILKTGRYQSTVTSGLVFSQQFLGEVMPMDQELFRQGGDGYLVTLAPLYGRVDGSDTKISAYRQHGGNHSGFNKLLLDRAKWCIAHDIQRYRALRLHAKVRGYAKQLGDIENSDILNLEQRMCVCLFEHQNDFESKETRFDLVKYAIHALGASNLSVVNVFVVKMWWYSLRLLPLKYARKIFSWKMLPSSRPLWFKKIAKFIRRV